MSCFYCEKDERLLALMTPLTELQWSDVYLFNDQKTRDAASWRSKAITTRCSSSMTSSAAVFLPSFPRGARDRELHEGG